MYQLRIKLDDEKIINDRKYELASLYKALDHLFVEEVGLEKREEDGTLIYYDEAEKNNTYADITGMCISLKNRCDWFRDNLLEWRVYSPDEGWEDLIEIFLKEDKDEKIRDSKTNRVSV